MGKYNGAVVTTAGQTLIANAIATNKKVTFTKLKASTHIYAASTNFEAMTNIADIVQSVDINYVGVYGNNIVQTSGKFDNTGVATAFDINTIGLYGKVENGSETLIAIVTAINADTMPVADPNSPTSIIYNIQMTVQNSGALEAEVNPAGTINVSQFNDALYSTALITVPTSGWSGSTPKFTTNIPVDGITSTSMPFVELKYPDDVTEEQKKAIDRAASKLVSLTTTNAGVVTLTATEVPTTSFQLMLRGLGSGQYTPDQSDIIYSVITKQEPYVERVGIDGLAKMELVGGTVAWDQLVFAVNAASEVLGITRTSVDDGKGLKYTGTSQRTTNFSASQILEADVIEGHKHLISLGDVLLPSGTRLSLASNDRQTSTIVSLAKSQRSWGVTINEGLQVDFTVYPQCIDLTQMFGITIADYVYSLEQSTEGSGIAWLQSYGFFTKDYYASDAGSLQSVCTSGRKVTDLSGNERTYPIDDVQLRGLFKLDTNNKLYCDGDVYKSSGAVTRKYGIVDLGTLSWAYSTTGDVLYSRDLQNYIKSGSSNSYVANMITPMYMTVSRNYIINNPTTDRAISVEPGGTVVVKDSSYTDAATFKTAMSGVYLVYELATETTETADPYINPQRSIENGTEEFVDGLTRDVMVPVGNVTQYYQSEIIPIISEYIDAVMASN
jgi:hypothetical protein